MSILERCPSYRESNKRSKERQGPTLKCPFYRGVHLIVVSVKRELTVLRIIHYTLSVYSMVMGLYMGQKIQKFT